MKEKVQIWHNTRCSKSRSAFDWLEKHQIETEWVDYMKYPVSREELQSLLQKLSLFPLELIRQNEVVFVENWKDQEKSADEWLEIMIQNPQLIQRPIVIKGNKAIIARPLELIEQLFNEE